jgi:signal transduction histidine kinase
MIELDKQPVARDSEQTTSSDGVSGENNSKGTSAEEKLRALVTDYETRLNEVADLITRVRHEINNPLTGVLGQAQLLLREELDESTRRRAEKIEELAIRIRDVVAELRKVQKISTT